jgi:hypothetical protein
VNSDEEIEKERKIIPETQAELNETSIIPDTVDPDKVTYVQVETKKCESNSGKKVLSFCR